MLGLEIKEFWKIGEKGGVVYCFVNDLGKKVQVFSTVDMIGHVGRVIRELGSSWKVIGDEVEEVKMKTLETGISKDDLLFRQACWTSDYKARGYTVYKETRSVKYSVFTTFEKLGHKYKYFVSLRNARQTEKIVVGVFATKKQGDEFVRKWYKDPVNITRITYSGSPDTKLFLQMQVEKLEKLTTNTVRLVKKKKPK